MQRVVRSVTVVVFLLVSLTLIGYSAWLWQLERGARSFEQGDLEGAAAFYAAAERPFARLPWLARLLKAQYSETIFSQVVLLYGRGKTDEAIGKMEQSAAAAPFLIERPEYGFWSGNVLLRRALRKGDLDDIMKQLNGASAHYRKGLEAAPDNWDLKYNYELSRYILAQRELDKKKEQAKIKTILERIRTMTETGEKEPPPPEKRG